jgi:hypothetical protein
MHEDDRQIRELAVLCVDGLRRQSDDFGNDLDRWRIDAARHNVEAIVDKLRTRPFSDVAMDEWILATLRAISYGWSDSSPSFTAKLDEELSEQLIKLSDLVSSRLTNLRRSSGTDY